MSGPETHINHSEKQSNNPLENTHSREFEQPWKRRANAVMKLKGGETVVFDKPSKGGAPKPSWNPEVQPGQALDKRMPQLMQRNRDLPRTNQLIALQNPAMMKRIENFIMRHYGEGVDKDITHLTPREAVDLARKILAERTEYDHKSPKKKGEQKRKKIEMLNGKDEIEIEEYMRTSLTNRSHHDRRDVESLLADPNDADVVCRNQSETFIVLFEALKHLQNPEMTQLNTSHVQITSTIEASSTIGTLPDGSPVFRMPNGNLYTTDPSLKSFDEDQTFMGEHRFAEGSIRKISDVEKKQIQYKSNAKLFADPSKNEGHALVQCITQDKDGRFHVLPLNTTVEGTYAEESGADYLNESILAWKDDSSWSELRKTYEQLFATQDPNSHTMRQLVAHYPLIMTWEAQESKRRLSSEEITWCKEQFESRRTKLSNSWMYANTYDEQLLVSIATAFIENGNITEAEEVVRFAKETKWQLKRYGNKEDLSAFGPVFDHLQSVIDQKKSGGNRMETAQK